MNKIYNLEILSNSSKIINKILNMKSKKICKIVVHLSVK